MPGRMLRIIRSVHSKRRISPLPLSNAFCCRRRRTRSAAGEAKAKGNNRKRNAMIWILFFATMALSLWAAARVKSVYRRYSQLPVRSGLTGAEVAAAILRRKGIRDVEITQGEGMLGDHYDPLHKRLVLSPENFHGSTPAALGVAAHECGHAIQHARAYQPLHWRMAAVGITTFAGQVV